MFKEILFDEKARKKIQEGVNIVADAVSSTLGPRGNNVIFSEGTIPTVTKDGVTVAQQILLEDKFQNLGAMMTREAAENTNREAGDSTTSTVSILRDIINEGYKYIAAGMNPILIKRGMEDAVDDVVKEIDKKKVDITSAEHVATISANNDKEMGKLIASVIYKVGLDGVVTVSNSNSIKTSVEYVNGTRIDGGYESHMFINDRKRLSVNLEDATIVLTTDKIDNQNELVGVIQTALTAGKKKMILIAGDIAGPAVAFLAQNHLLGKFTCVPVKMSSFGDYQRDLFYDLAALTGATVLGKEEPKTLDDATEEDFGTAKNVIVTREHTTVIGSDGDTKERIEEVKTLLGEEKDTFKITKLKERLGKLTGSIANILVGGASETEQMEKRYRIEDAINATRSAIEDGIVEGGGTTLLRISENIKPNRADREYVAGYEIVKNAIKKPFRQILENSGLSPDAIAAKVLGTDNGYNALTGEFENLIETGVIDPVKCVKSQVINAVATAGTLMTSNVAIVEKEDDNNN